MERLDLLEEPSYTACMLRESYRAQREVVEWLRQPARSFPLTVAEIDGVLLRWLHACYLKVSSLPSFSRGQLPLGKLLAMANLLDPFIERGNPEEGSGGLPTLAIGFPSNPDAHADSLPELVRMAGAAIFTYDDYLTRPCQPGSIPKDEAALLFSSIAIRSCLDPTVAATMDRQAEAARTALSIATATSAAQAEAKAAGAARGDDEATIAAALSAISVPLPVPPPSPNLTTIEGLLEEATSFSQFGVSEIRWLMHWLRGELSTYFGEVQYIVGNKKGCEGHLVASQQDKLCLLKLVPGNLASYVMYCRSCLQFQQTKAAYIFSSKGIVVAEKLRDDAHKAQLLLINATAAALGGSGPTFSYSAAGRALMASVESKERCLVWLSKEHQDRLDLDPELSIVEQKVVAGLAATASAAAGGEPGAEVILPCLQDHYGVPEPSSVPPGAVEEDGKGGGTLRAVTEVTDEEEEASRQQQGGGGGGGAKSHEKKGRVATAAAASPSAPAAAAAGSGKKPLVKGNRTKRSK